MAVNPSSLDDRELYFAAALVNPKVRSAVRGHLKDLDWSSDLAQSVAEYFLGLQDGQQYEKIVLHGHLVHDFLGSEINEMMARCLEIHRVSKEDGQGLQAGSILAEFQKFYNRKVTSKIIRDHQNDPEKLLEEIEKLQKMKFASLPLDVLGDLDVDRIIEEELGNILFVPSAFECVRESCAPADGYQTGQVVMVCARPGAGKTNFLAHEVVNLMHENEKIVDERDKFRVYWLALGDMNRFDFIIRMTAIHFGIPFNDVKRTPQQYYTDDVKRLFRYVKITTVPAAHIDIYGAKYFIENTVTEPSFDPQVIIIDYDANLLSNRETMYLSGEETYNVASSIAKPIGRPGRLVFVASQPKIEYWSLCPMPMEAAAESSRKQAIIDMMITIARDPACAKGKKVGKMLIAKNRRGEDGIISLYQLDQGLFKEIDDSVYVTSLESTSSGGGYSGGKNKRGKLSKQYGS